MPAVSLTVNGKAVTADVDPRTLLVQFLREHLRLTGTHVGCDTSQCGACLVHINGVAVKSCTTLVLQAEGTNVLTIQPGSTQSGGASSGAGTGVTLKSTDADAVAAVAGAARPGLYCSRGQRAGAAGHRQRLCAGDG